MCFYLLLNNNNNSFINLTYTKKCTYILYYNYKFIIMIEIIIKYNLQDNTDLNYNYIKPKTSFHYNNNIIQIK